MNYKSIFILLLMALSSIQAQAQGCVAIRHFSSCSSGNPTTNILMPGEWQLGMNYRYFKSFRHFRGTHEEPDRVTNNTEVVNHSHNWDFTLTRGLSNRWYASFTLPLIINTRSSLYEHGREERYTTFSRGVGDARVGLGFWLLSSEVHTTGNLAISAGIKLPTGNYQATDIFYNVGPEASPQVRPVDQSIQLGDGGFGVTLDFQFYQKLFDNLYFYGGGFYLINPREVNGVRTFRETLSPILENESIMSVPDQYALRGGFSYALISTGWGMSIGARYEGVPVEDLIGGSEGFRRPGSVLSVEPGISYMKGNLSLNVSVPVAVRRNRPQSLTDLETQQATGNPRNGDAAFADYLINIGLSFRLPGKNHEEAPLPIWENLNN